MNAPSPGLHSFAPSQSGSGETATTILLVEDEPTILALAKLYLEQKGFRVIPANDGEEAIALWQKCDGEVDLVLTDVVMPRGVDGHQLVQRLKAEQPDLKAIFVSGYAADSLGNETALDEDTNFLQKPYRLQNLVEMVYGCLERAPARGVNSRLASSATAASTLFSRCCGKRTTKRTAHSKARTILFAAGATYLPQPIFRKGRIRHGTSAAILSSIDRRILSHAAPPGNEPH